MVTLNFIKNMNVPQRIRPKLKENTIPSIFRNVSQNQTDKTSQYEIVPKTVTMVLELYYKYLY